MDTIKKCNFANFIKKKKLYFIGTANKEEVDYIYTNYYYEVDVRYNNKYNIPNNFYLFKTLYIDDIRIYSIYKKNHKIMKIFIYKSLLVCFLFFVMFHLTFGYVVKSYKNKIFNTFSKDKINYVKDKMRSEIKNYNEKENILYPEDAEIFGKFLRKLLSELNDIK